MDVNVDAVQLEIIEVVEVSQVATTIEITAPADGVVFETVIEHGVTVEAPPVIQYIEVEVGIPGPPGPAAGETMPYAERIDFVGEDIIYKGLAIPGSVDAAPVWQVCKIEFIDGDAVKTWANGNAYFEHSWVSRTSLTYS